MTEAECREALQQAKVARLACARDDQPYVIPIYFMLDNDYAYAFTTFGQKVEWMRTNPRVCLEIDERSKHDQWQSVVLFGRYEELPDLPKFEAARKTMLELVQQHPMWWEPAYVGASHRDLPNAENPIFFRIHIERVTGRRGTPDLVKPACLIEQEKRSDGWWSEILRHLGLRD
jgi:nitroimidazol reductase NimA-like FMN-containing flavoprotein (pyridoxamine 5'-phosphate oxidase superfamily)